MTSKRSKGRAIISLALGLLVLGVLATIFRKKEAASPSLQVFETEASVSNKSAILPTEPASVPDATETIDNSGAPPATPTEPLTKLSPDEKRVAQAIELSMKTKPELKLSGEQVKILVNDLTKYIHNKAEIEKKLVRVDSYDGTELTATIPPYPIEGKALKEAFYDQLNQDLGPEIAGIVSAPNALGGWFATYLSGFGKLEQSYRLMRNPNQPNEVMLNWAWTLPSDYVFADGESGGGRGTGNSMTVEYWGASHFGGLHDVMIAYFGGK